MDEDLKTTGFKKWDDVELQPDGTVREITRVRFWLGIHGPFDRKFARGVGDADIGQVIATERQSIRSISSY